MLSEGIARKQGGEFSPSALGPGSTCTAHCVAGLHFIDVSTDVGTQLEHRCVAEQCRAIFTAQFPVIAEAAWA
jgi:Predicted alternative thymidylate synthase